MATDGFRHTELRLALSVSQRRRYRIDLILPRHFEETADAAKVPSDIRRSAFADLAQIGFSAIEAVADALPAGFPDRVAGPILAHARNRMHVLADYVDAGLVGR